jgi:apolipoprotein N-acyltransferase
VLACAGSAGAHAGLAPAHLRSEPRLGVAFTAAAVLLVASAVALAHRPSDHRLATGVAVLLGGLVAAYVASRTTGIPLLDPEPEQVEAVGVATCMVEALGLASALWLGQPLGHHPRRSTAQEVSR